MYTISDIELTDVTEEEQQFLDQDWNDFKGDVSMKTLMDKLDRAIKRRRRLYLSDDDAETESIAAFRKMYSRFKPMKLVAMVLYVVLPFFEKPAWCIKNADIDIASRDGYWFC